MKIDNAIAHFGSQVALADALGVQQPAVSMWKSRGAIPHLQQIRIEHLTKGKLKAKPLLPAKGKRKVSRT
jgi:DNA-binding transcriptional regulator YdaS (Cro superfamily)